MRKFEAPEIEDVQVLLIDVSLGHASSNVYTYTVYHVVAARSFNWSTYKGFTCGITQTF
jgi:hypothetical protein